jgi:hypothetical protein
MINSHDYCMRCINEVIEHGDLNDNGWAEPTAFSTKARSCFDELVTASAIECNGDRVRLLGFGLLIFSAHAGDAYPREVMRKAGQLALLAALD